MHDRFELKVLTQLKNASLISKTILIFKRYEDGLVVRRSRVSQSARLRFLSVLSGEVDQSLALPCDLLTTFSFVNSRLFLCRITESFDGSIARCV
jgi:hypothetical protein